MQANILKKDVNVVQAYSLVIYTHLKMLIKHLIWRHIFLAIVLIFFILSFAPHVVKNTPVKLELVKPNQRPCPNLPTTYQATWVSKTQGRRTCGKGTFKIFPLLQMRSSEIDLRKSYERNFMKKYKTKLNNL